MNQYVQTSPIQTNKEQLVVMERYPKAMKQGEPAKLWMNILLSRSNMEKSLKEVASYNGGEALIVDHEGKWLVGALPQEKMTFDHVLRLLHLDDKAESGSGIGRFIIDNQSYVYAYESSSLLGATLVAYVPESSFLGPIRWYTRLYILLAGTSLLVVLIFSVWLYNLVHKPMLRLTGAFRKLEKGSFNTLLSYDRKDEFHYLYQQFNRMSSRLEELINEAYEHEMRLNRAELKQLQAQINPHFLYNIFFLLNRIIKLEDMENAKRLTKYLGQFFRFITRNKEDEVQLKEEMAHIEAYIGIQSIRFGSKLSVQMEKISVGAESTLVPRLILQPIVENAFEYGLEDHPHKGILEIYWELQKDSLCLHVEDNGESLTDAMLDKLVSGLQGRATEGETTGILNIHRRIQLKFGSEYGLSVRRSHLGGLHVIVRLPSWLENQKEE
ncbi:histidine kinase [Paenibacillus sp. D2_2]|uniref:sensor histidine kinase n=1 Tax=Paenibacillus sp. D2_2 TaxID=3073092 RepID=UPI0028153382|nr:histidine kinase [Paenibacillus sp. D2_2]WMT39455.1 histidine kinase [Paenibacillus sp. D2_2]